MFTVITVIVNPSTHEDPMGAFLSLMMSLPYEAKFSLLFLVWPLRVQ